MRNKTKIFLCLLQAYGSLFGVTFETLTKSESLLILQKSSDVVRNRLELIELCKNVEDFQDYVAFLRGGYALAQEPECVPDSMLQALIASARAQIDSYIEDCLSHPEWNVDLVFILDGLSVLSMEISNKDVSPMLCERFEQWLELSIDMGRRILGDVWECFMRDWANVVRDTGKRFARETLLETDKNEILAIPGLQERLELFVNDYQRRGNVTEARCSLEADISRLAAEVEQLRVQVSEQASELERLKEAEAERKAKEEAERLERERLAEEKRIAKEAEARKVENAKQKMEVPQQNQEPVFEGIRGQDIINWINKVYANEPMKKARGKRGIVPGKMYLTSDGMTDIGQEAFRALRRNLSAEFKEMK